MVLYKYDNLMSLDTSTYDWTCRVRAQAMWKGMNRETQEYWGLNMLFIDDSNCRIHAFANSKYCSEFEKELVEGGVYTLSNFKVKDFLGDETYRPVRNKKHIYFTKDTKLKPNTEEGLKIEKFAFDLFHFAEIEKLATDNRFLVDMVGVMKNRTQLITSSKNNQDKNRLKFDLVDGRNSVSVTLFDDFALAFNQSLPVTEDEDIILIISCAKVNRYEGKPQLTNYPATRIYINADHYSVENMKNRKHSLSDTSSDEAEEPKPLLTLQQITKLKEDHIEKEVCCEIFVKKIPQNNKWYVTNCSNCPTEVHYEGDKFKCSNCNRFIPHPRRRFRLITLSADNTASVTIIFPDSEVSRISQKVVEDLYFPDKEEIGEQGFPPFLQMFENQKYLITLLLTKENITKRSKIYQATELGEMMESSGNFTPGNQQVMDVQDISEMKEMGTQGNTSKSINTKTRGRKITESVPFNDEHESPEYKNSDRQKKAK